MTKKTFLFLSVALLLQFTLAAADPAALIAEGDSLYDLREDQAQAKLAMAKYREALQLDEKNYDALWRAARAIYWVGIHLAKKDDKVKIFREGIDICKRAIALKANGVEGHFWLGVCYGEYGLARGKLKSLFLKGDIIDEMNVVIRLDDKYEDGGAYRVLGKLYYEVPGIFGGSNKKSRNNLEKSLQIAPKNTLSLLYLAETLWDMDEEKLAIKTLEKLLATEPDAWLIPETKEDKVAAHKLLKKYKED